MKTIQAIILALSLSLILFTSCDKEITLPELTTLLPVSDTTINVGKELLFHAEVKSDLTFEYQWFVDDTIRSTDPAFLFTPNLSGNYSIKVKVSNRYGSDSLLARIKVLPREYLIDFEELPLGISAYWNGSDGSGKFISGIASFTNNFKATKPLWDGFSYSNLNDTVNSENGNIYSVFDSHNQDNQFAVFNYAPAIPSFITFDSEKALNMISLKICNTSPTALNMLNGSATLKKFGGETGNDPDYLKVIITGIDTNGNSTGTVETFLSDFRNSNNLNYYILKKWTLVDLSSLGKIKKLYFSVHSSWTDSAILSFALDEIKYYDPE